MKWRNLLSIGVLVTVTGLGWYAFERRYDIHDWYQLRNYTPSAEVERLAGLASMNDYAKRLFYVHDPQIQGRGDFNGSCSLDHEGLILGCYDGSGIYIFDVDEEALEKIEQVTAAHEMLHAAYDRLSGSERDRLHELLAVEYERIESQRLLNIIELYRLQDPTVLNNELHSIIGTEVLDISPELEEYYSQYFVDRALVVNSAQEYEAVFLALQEEIDSIEGQLQTIAADIERREANLSAQREQIQTRRAELDRLLAEEAYEEYNQAVPGFNQLVTAYNSGVETVRSRVNEYNRLLEQYRATAFQQNQYVNSLDSSFEPI